MDNQKTSLIIRKKLRERGTTAKKMIEELNINSNFMYSLEKGTKPSIETIEKVAEYLNITIDELLGGNSQKDLKIIESTIGDKNIIGHNNNYNESLDEITKEIIHEINKLNTKEKIKVINYIYKIQEEKN